jgi:hypothetical protein
LDAKIEDEDRHGRMGMRNVFVGLNTWISLSLLLAIACGTGSASAQRVIPPPPKEQLSVEELATLERLRRQGEAVYSVGSRACVVELDRLASDRETSKHSAPSISADTMKASFENDMFFAQARLATIVNYCGAAENRGDYDQTEAFLKQLADSCSLTFSDCEAKRHY